MTPWITASALALSLLAACQPQTQPATLGTVPRQRANECVYVCHQLGMRMTAMVVIMNGAGCVCEPELAPVPQGYPPGATPGAAGAAPSAAASAASGGAVIAAAAAAAEAQRQAAQQQQQQQRQQQQQQQQQQHNRR